jgi:hypothetical protein
MAQLSITTPNEEGDSVTRTFHIVDEHVDDEADQLQALAAQAEAVPELREERNALKGELETATDVIVSDIIRRKKIAGDLEEDGVESEREYLEGLPIGRLKMEYERAPSEADLDTSSATENKNAQDVTNDLSARYQDAGL